jgi:hypothetical protein
MLKEFLFGTLCIAVLAGCINLKHVNEYSDHAVAGIGKFEEVDYGFSQYCRERCEWAAIDSLKILRGLDCQCDLYRRADSVTQILYGAAAGYFDGLSRLSKNNLTRYHFDPLKKALKEEDLDVFQVKKEDVDAYTKIAAILTRSFTDLYRKRKIKDYIRSANPPVQTLLSKLVFIESENLRGLLKFKSERLFDHYRMLLKSAGMNRYEKQSAAAEYYKALHEIGATKSRIGVYSRSLKAVAKGHQKLYDNLDKISAADIKLNLTQSAGDLRDLISEFNKLRSK